MPSKRTLPRFLAYYREELPAFHAGFVVTLLVLSSLLNLGAFVLLLAARTTLDIVKCRERERMGWRETLGAVVQAGLLEYVLFTFLLLATIFLQESGVLFGGGVRAAAELLRGGVFFALKGVLLFRLLPVLLHPRSYIEECGVDMRRPFSSVEQSFLLALVTGLLLLGLSPAIVNGGWQKILQILRKQIVPWKL